MTGCCAYAGGGVLEGLDEEGEEGGREDLGAEDVELGGDACDREESSLVGCALAS